MMLYKSFVSLLTALAVVGSVAASATPVARGGYPPPSPPPVSQCNTGSVQCCDILTNSNNPVLDLLEGLLPLGTIIDPTLIVGLTCSVINLGNPCNEPICCGASTQTGILDVNCVPVTL